MKHEFHGVYPALVTPFDEKGEVWVQAMRDLVAYHLDKSVDGFYVCGSTGQGVTQSVAERRLVAETVMEAAGDRVPVIVHVGAVALPDATALAAHAQSIGAAGISTIIPPLYTSLESLNRYFSAVAAAAPDITLFPYLKGGAVRALDLLDAISGIPNLGGTKVTGPDMDELKKIIDMRPQPWVVFSGMDEQTLFAAMAGSSGNIGSSVNVIPGVYQRIHSLFRDGKHSEAMALQHRGNAVIAVLASFGYSGALRTALDMLGLPCGQPRIPDSTFPVGRRKKLEAELERVGFAELSSM